MLQKVFLPPLFGFMITAATLTGCGSTPDATSAANQSSEASAGSAGAAGFADAKKLSNGGAAGQSAQEGVGGGKSTIQVSGAIASSQTFTGHIVLTQTLTVEPGVTLTLAAGTFIEAAAGAALVVQGALIAQGVSASPVTLQSQTHSGPGGWVGVQLASGGTATLTQVAVHDAIVALDTKPGSMYFIDYINVDTSSRIALLSSKGTLQHGVLHALGQQQVGEPIVITDASPQISYVILDRARDNVDQIQVNQRGQVVSSPIFEHMDVSQCHCAFHFNGGTHIVIRDSYVHDSLYGVMNTASRNTTIQDSNFENNGTNIGACSTGDVTASHVFFTQDPFDTSCSKQTNSMPAPSVIPHAGVMGP